LSIPKSNGDPVRSIGRYLLSIFQWLKLDLSPQAREVNTLLGDIINHMNVNRAFEHHYPQLQAVVERVLSHATDLESLFAMVIPSHVSLSIDF